jgi:hypothetical protein
MKILCKQIQKNRTIKILNLRNNDICLQKMQSLTDALKDNQNIEKIDLSWNKLDLKLLCELIKSKQNLKNLDISHAIVNEYKSALNPGKKKKL